MEFNYPINVYIMSRAHFLSLERAIKIDFLFLSSCSSNCRFIFRQSSPKLMGVSLNILQFLAFHHIQSTYTTAHWVSCFLIFCLSW